MDCEEFEALAADFESDVTRTAEANEHLRNCVRCAELLQVQQELQQGLHVLARETESAQTPLRVELALRERVRAKRSLLSANWRIAAVGWAALVLIVFGVWLTSHEWVRRQRSSASQARAVVAAPGAATQLPSVAETQTVNQERSMRISATGPSPGHARKSRETSGRSPHAGKFVALPYSTPATDGDYAFVMRVQMRRAELSGLGLQVNEERADEPIQVDLMLGVDGQPQAVRFLR